MTNLTKEDLINLNEFIEEVSGSDPAAARKALEAMDMADKPWKETLHALKLEIDSPTEPCGQSECADCGKVWKDDDVVPLSEVHRLWERISPGEIVPSGGCPGCGALCHPTTKKG